MPVLPTPVQSEVSKQPHQKTQGYDSAYIARFIPTWNRPTYSADAWRAVVKGQQIATLCRDTLINRLLSLDWKITPRDSSLSDELRGTINHYSRLFEKTGYGVDLDYTSHVEWVVGDLLDTPFGGCAEIGRKDDSPSGRVMWIKPLDVANLYPTNNFEYPVVESYMGNMVALPKEYVARTFMSPVKKIEYQGWGTPPPEKIFMALQMISQGDGYYANLLMDVPSVGILDLGDMEQKSAKEWVEAYQSMLMNGGNQAFKIPVLYEHNTKVEFLSLGKVPNDIMFDRITLRYMAIVTAGYGMTLADLGISSTTNGGDTLAGAIRSERLTAKSGFALAKKKWAYYANSILPPTLQWTFIDYDDEHNLNVGRARLATVTAFSQAIDKNIITPATAQAQMIVDGLITVSISKEAPDVFSTEDTQKTPERPGMVGSPISPSQGGYGEIRSKVPQFRSKLNRLIDSTVLTIRPVLDTLSSAFEDDDKFIARVAMSKKSIPIDLSKVKADWLPEELLIKIKSRIVDTLSVAMLKDDGLDVDNPYEYDEFVSNMKNEIFKLFEE